jgi:CHAT domain-containing protein
VDAERPWNSALVLAPGGGHDGRLTALDVVGLDLQADLAVLSACDTARGRVVRGDGVVGLLRAFLAAGTPRVLVSLWKVDDAATSALMRRFYELWKDGSVSAARALRDAQSSIRSQERWKDPCYWAGWELWGLPD